MHEPLTKADIKNTVAGSVEAVVPLAIQQHVNGHIKRVDQKVDDAKIQLEAVNQKLDGHIEQTRINSEIQDKKWQAMEPVQAAAQTINNIVRLFKWLAPLIAGIGGIIALFSL